MTPDYLQAAASLFHAFTFERLVPLAMVLLVGTLFGWVLWRAQQRDDFDAADFLKNDAGKYSFERIAAGIALLTHVWIIFTRTLSEKVTFEEQVLFAVTWSGSLVLMQALSVWKGKP